MVKKIQERQTNLIPRIDRINAVGRYTVVFLIIIMYIEYHRNDRRNLSNSGASTQNSRHTGYKILRAFFQR